MKNVLLFVFLFVTVISFSQTKDHFREGFNAGYKSICQKNGDGRCNFGDPIDFGQMDPG